MSMRSVSALTASASPISIFSCSIAQVKARYIAPVSMYKYPSLLATSRAALLFPAPAGPSMATVKRSIPYSSFAAAMPAT